MCCSSTNKSMSKAQSSNQNLHYKDHKALFQKIPVQERAAWTQKMLTLEQKTGEYQVFKIDYPNHGKWQYKGCEYHYYYSLSQIQPAKAILFYFHGLNAHSNSSGYLTQNIAKTVPIDAYGLDYKNFGRSGGEDRGYIQSLDSLVEEAYEFIGYILSQQKQKKKIFISGLSLGGAVCFKLAIRNPEFYDGVIFLSPALKENKQSSPFMKKIGRLIGTWFPKSKLLDQKFTEASKINQTDLIMKDPYVYKDKIIPGSIRALLEGMEQIQKQWSKFTSPFIMIQSGCDKLVDPFQGIDFQKQCKSNDKTVIYFKDMWHSVFNEEEMPQVVQAVEEWLSARVNK